MLLPKLPVLSRQPWPITVNYFHTSLHLCLLCEERTQRPKPVPAMMLLFMNVHDLSLSQYLTCLVHCSKDKAHTF